MKCLVTGANGLLGKAVVQSLLDAGQSVRAVVRPTCQHDGLPWASEVEFVKVDLRRASGLDALFEGIDCTIHLAAQVGGADDAQFLAGPVATENLLRAMENSDTKNIVFCSSFSVYDWSKSHFSVNEQTSLEGKFLYRRDGYAIAKTWQERVVREFATRNSWNAIVLRPGFIWGRGNEWCSGAGLMAGSRIVVNGPLRRLPLTYIENCAQAFVRAALKLHGQVAGATANSARSGTIDTYNVIDQDTVTAWRFTGDFIRNQAQSMKRLAVPDMAFRMLAFVAAATSRLCFGKNWKLPGVLMPNRYRARFASRRFPNSKIVQELGWQPRYNYSESLKRTYSV